MGCLWGHQGICIQRRGCFSFLFFPLLEICSFLFEINAFIVHVYGKMLTDFVLINDIIVLGHFAVVLSTKCKTLP